MRFYGEKKIQYIVFLGKKNHKGGGVDLFCFTLFKDFQ